MLIPLLIACSAARMPGPLGHLGRPATESAAEWIARRNDAVEDEAAAEGEAEDALDDAVGGERPAPGAAARRIVEAARSFVGDGRLVVAGESYRYDCSGLVEAALARAGVPERGSSADLHARARELGVLHHRKLPRPGDVAFFDDTYDRNGNRLLDDPLSHSAIVERVWTDGTIEMVHLGSGSVRRLRMNLRHPSERLGPDGGTWNDYLRARSSRDPGGTRYLSGELWTAFASFYEAHGEVVAAR